jgi:hypothetical protein
MEEIEQMVLVEIFFFYVYGCKEHVQKLTSLRSYMIFIFLLNWKCNLSNSRYHSKYLYLQASCKIIFKRTIIIQKVPYNHTFLEPEEQIDLRSVSFSICLLCDFYDGLTFIVTFHILGVA